MMKMKIRNKQRYKRAVVIIILYKMIKAKRLIIGLNLRAQKMTLIEEYLVILGQ